MAECEVYGELVDRSGGCQRFSARSRCTIQGILGGVRSLQEQLGGALNEMVLQEKQKQQLDAERTASGSDDEEADDDDDDSEDESANKGDDAPPTKRTRTQS